MTEIKKTPEQWLEDEDFMIIDPDGWRHEDAPAWDEPITKAEFDSRLLECTVAPKNWGM